MRLHVEYLLILLLCFAFAPIAAEDAPTTPTLSRWEQHYENRVALFREENASLRADERPIVFVGDSITEGMPIAKLYPGEYVLNRGISSDGTADHPKAAAPHHRGLTNRLDESIFDLNPRVVFILMGTNDVGQTHVPLEYWLGELEGVLERIEKEIPDCRVVLETLPPSGPPYKRVENLNSRAKEYNAMLRQLAKDRGLAIIDLWELYANDDGILPADLTRDGLHLKKEAYERWAAEARKYFSE